MTRRMRNSSKSVSSSVSLQTSWTPEASFSKLSIQEVDQGPSPLRKVHEREEWPSLCFFLLDLFLAICYTAVDCCCRSSFHTSKVPKWCLLPRKPVCYLSRPRGASQRLCFILNLYHRIRCDAYGFIGPSPLHSHAAKRSAPAGARKGTRPVSIPRDTHLQHVKYQRWSLVTREDSGASGFGQYKQYTLSLIFQPYRKALQPVNSLRIRADGLECRMESS